MEEQDDDDNDGDENEDDDDLTSLGKNTPTVAVVTLKLFKVAKIIAMKTHLRVNFGCSFLLWWQYLVPFLVLLLALVLLLVL